ncbi:thioesterase family protein [Rhodoplanes sp. TEM]|uniref:Thioesterase family protein n=1 Tax=Rhodoplanes tepidamans TaxID=200616 RepID=A0ABT5JB45_RHOTP|nr:MULTISPECIES: thioesterase family protein [Rhodoplanes]MDC7786663.1 thioesterase family protein [Rhodoplanes tepidamans]MDC7982990.1 thioesterase family protein [Rhodoplanes sp. TEM]MDQ0356372.1 acyl-CoA thioester hydrolase [Rhodoplanes tepidamans]
MTDESTARHRRPPRPDEFPHRVVHTIRFRDLDPQNHVNNAVFLTFFEGGRVPLLRDPRYGLWVDGATYVQANLTIDYLAEIHWPGEVVIGTRVARVGTSSLTFDQAVFSGDRCAGLALSTLVLIDRETRKPRPFPEAIAARLRAGGGTVPEVG